MEISGKVYIFNSEWFYPFSFNLLVQWKHMQLDHYAIKVHNSRGGQMLPLAWDMRRLEEACHL